MVLGVRTAEQTFFNADYCREMLQYLGQIR
jgi:hypothetical protein